jgi:hypothetical protein
MEQLISCLVDWMERDTNPVPIPRIQCQLREYSIFKHSSAIWAKHRLNMELDLQIVFGLHVHVIFAHLYLLAETPQLPPPPITPHLGSYRAAIG